jgi:hypothetical protein
MREVSREASTGCPAGLDDVVRDLLFAGGPVGVLDPLGDDCLGDGGVHCSSLSIESWFSTAIRMS